MKTVNLATFIENPDNPQTVTAEDFALLVESLRTMPQTLAASKIAYVTDYTAVDGADLRGQRVVIAGNKRLRALKQLAADHATSADGAIKFDGPLPAEWFYDLTPLGANARRAWLVKSNVYSGEWDAEKLLALYDRDELGDLMGDAAIEEILKAADKDEPKDGKTDPDAVPDAPEKPVSRSSEDYISFASSVLGACFDNCARFIFWNVSYNANSRSEYIAQIVPFLSRLIEQVAWKKTSAVPLRGSMRRAWEPIYVFSINGEGLPVGEVVTNIWEISNMGAQGKDHKACFPVALPEKGIEASAARSVLDPFCGTGTTIIAAEKKGIRAFGMELDPHYCDVIRKRWAEFVHGEGCDWKALTPRAANVPRKEGK